MEKKTPRVALHSGVVALLDEPTLDAVDIVEISPDGDRDALDLNGVRFLAPGPFAQWVVPRLADLPDLEVLQTASAGTDWAEPRLPKGVTLCSAHGTRDAPVAEWALGALLGVATHLLECAGSSSWEKFKPADLGDWTVLIVGMGSIGRKLQSYLAPLGSTVVGVASRAREDLHGIDELDDLLPTANAVVLLTPLNEDTRHLINSERLARMANGAVLVNAARGAVIDTDALLQELARGRIHAVLDVTDPEPLPDGHPLWDAPGVLAISPHTAGTTAGGDRAAHQLAADQLRRWLAGEGLSNVVVGPNPG